MAVFNGAFPVLPGKEDDARRFAQEVTSTQKSGFDEQNNHNKITRETWTLQDTPMGSFVLVWYEAPDVEAPFADLASRDTEFTKWFVGRVKEVTGVDLSVSTDNPTPDVLLDWSS